MILSRERPLGSNAKATEQVRWLRGAGGPLRDARDLDPLMERIGDARYVLLGEASHGTSEYYAWRAALSRRLIEEKGFSFIAVEGDWPDCYAVNCYAKGVPDSGGCPPSGRSPREVLRAFDRWPTWMWANEEIEDLAEWLRDRNDGRPDAEKTGFYGLDVYSLWDSMHAVIRYLEKTGPDALQAAWQAFRCFEPFGEDPQEYAWATMISPASCEEEVVRMLAELRRQAADGRGAEILGEREAHFNAEQNALVAQNAERYYRAMVRGGANSWNVRDRHMVETLERLMRHHGPAAKVIVWEHNTHVGDARATDMARAGMVNVGQLVREAHAAGDVVVAGFGSYEGTVIAGTAWGAPMRRMNVPPAEPGSWEHLFHHAGSEDRLLIFRDRVPSAAREPRGHRAIGVVYHPDQERYGNYVPTVLPDRYDAFLYVDQTQALHPLPVEAHPEPDLPETYPTGV
jgi:erythromycin esterase